MHYIPHVEWFPDNFLPAHCAYPQPAVACLTLGTPSTSAWKASSSNRFFSTGSPKEKPPFSFKSALLRSNILYLATQKWTTPLFWPFFLWALAPLALFAVSPYSQWISFTTSPLFYLSVSAASMSLIFGLLPAAIPATAFGRYFKRPYCTLDKIPQWITRFTYFKLSSVSYLVILLTVINPVKLWALLSNVLTVVILYVARLPFILPHISADLRTHLALVEYYTATLLQETSLFVPLNLVLYNLPSVVVMALFAGLCSMALRLYNIKTPLLSLGGYTIAALVFMCILIDCYTEDTSASQAIFPLVIGCIRNVKIEHTDLKQLSEQRGASATPVYNFACAQRRAWSSRPHTQCGGLLGRTTRPQIVSGGALRAPYYRTLRANLCTNKHLKMRPTYDAGRRTASQVLHGHPVQQLAHHVAPAPAPFIAPAPAVDHPIPAPIHPPVFVAVPNLLPLEPAARPQRAPHSRGQSTSPEKQLHRSKKSAQLSSNEHDAAGAGQADTSTSSSNHPLFDEFVKSLDVVSRIVRFA